MNARALVAEQDGSVNGSLALALETRGIAASVAVDAEAAFEQLLAEDFDLIIFNVELPGTDATEMMQRLSMLQPRPLAVALTADLVGTPSGLDGRLVPMIVSTQSNLETLADILSRSAFDYHQSSH